MAPIKNASLRIGVNALFLIPGGVGGTEIYVRSLLPAMASVDENNEYFVFVNRETMAGLPLVVSPRFHVIPCGLNAGNRPLRILWEQCVLPFLLRKHHIDVLLNLGFTAPFLFRPSVTVFQDLQHKRHPEFFRFFDLPFWNILLRQSAERSRTLIAASQATAADLEKFYPGTGARTVVIPHGVDPEFFNIGLRRRARVQPAGDRYLLTVSTLHPHKNLDRLMQAFRIFRRDNPEFRLVIAGMKGFATKELELLRNQSGLSDAVTFTGWIPRENLYELFEHAWAFVAPSRFEGFGLPIIEALAAGIPSACSDIPVFREFAGSAVARFDPNSVDQIVAALHLVSNNTEFRSIAAISGTQQANRCNWTTSALQTLRTVQNAAKRR